MQFIINEQILLTPRVPLRPVCHKLLIPCMHSHVSLTQGITIEAIYKTRKHKLKDNVHMIIINLVILIKTMGEFPPLYSIYPSNQVITIV